jgi:hypothetical protein
LTGSEPACACGSRENHRRDRFVTDSPLEGDGFEPSVPVAREPVYIAEGELGDRRGSQKNSAGYRWFESISLQRRVSCELAPYLPCGPRHRRHSPEARREPLVLLAPAADRRARPRGLAAGIWYNWRALVEADIGRYKRVIGDALRSRTEARQTTEVALAVASLNRMLKLGRPEYVRLK